MRRNLLWMALAALILPILVRVVWFYNGIPSRPEIATPDYLSLVLPQPPMETPSAEQVSETKPLGGTVLVDYAHVNQFQPGEIQSLKDDIDRRGGELEFNTDVGLLENSLKYSSAYVVISPSVGFTSSEILAIHAFVARGGRLAVFTDATRGITYVDFFSGATIVSPDVNAANPLLAGFGITVNDDYLYNLAQNEGNFRNVYFDEFGKNELTFGLRQVALYGTHSIRSDRGLILFLGAESTLSSLTDAHHAAEGGAALSDDGNVAVFGDFTFLTPPYNNVADNATLISNVADFLLGGERTITLANFPYVFGGKAVQVLPTSGVQMTAELVGALGRLQTSLQLRNISMQITGKPPREGDMIVLGTFTPTEDLMAFIETFDLSLDDFSEFVEVPGFGKVGRNGNGILLFESGESGNTLILLTNSMDDLTFLLDSIGDGILDSCLLRGDTGICSIGFGGSFSEEPTEVPVTPSTGEPTEEGLTPTPPPPATPGG